MRQYIGVPEAAARYGVENGTVYEWIRANRIPYRRWPHRKAVKFLVDDLDAFDDGATDLVVKRLKGGGKIVVPKADEVGRRP